MKQLTQGYSFLKKKCEFCGLTSQLTLFLCQSPVMSPFPVTEGQLASSVSFRQKAVRISVSAEDEGVLGGGDVVGVGSFESPILRRTSIFFGIGQKWSDSSLSLSKGFHH